LEPKKEEGVFFLPNGFLRNRFLPKTKNKINEKTWSWWESHQKKDFFLFIQFFNIQRNIKKRPLKRGFFGLHLLLALSQTLLDGQVTLDARQPPSGMHALVLDCDSDKPPNLQQTNEGVELHEHD